jgi:hypothetical protein
MSAEIAVAANIPKITALLTQLIERVKDTTESRII